jgi:transposase
VFEYDGEVIERVAALDIGKQELVACVRAPEEDRPARRRQQVREFGTTTRQLLALADWLRVERVQLVSMESTSDYWKPVYYLLEAEGFRVWLLNARHVKNAPGRPKTDKLDAVWLARVTEQGMVMPSLVHPKPIRRLRDLTRYRRSVVRDQTREKQRLEKLLEDAGIKLSSVAKDILGVSGREMIEALIAGQRNPEVLAQMARTRLRRKIPQLREALTGYFEDHHAQLARMMLERIDDAEAKVAELDAQIQVMLEPFHAQAAQLDTIVGIGPANAAELIAEIGVDMSRFPTPGHLVSWAKFCPIDQQSAGKRTKNASTGKGNPWLAATLGDIAMVISTTPTFLGDRYRRIAKRRGKKKAIVAVGNSVLTVIWHLLTEPGLVFTDLGPDYYQSKHATQRRTRNLIRQLEAATGQRVTLAPAA